VIHIELSFAAGTAVFVVYLSLDSDDDLDYVYIRTSFSSILVSNNLLDACNLRNFFFKVKLAL